MKNRKILLGMLVIVLAFGMTVIGCDEPEDPDYPFKGSWSGSYTETGEPSAEAKVTFTETAWTLTVGENSTELNKGSYTWKKTGVGSGATLKVKLEGQTVTAGTATLSAGILGFSITTGFTGAGSGSFKRVKGDPLAGTWSGDYKLTGESTSKTATITFTPSASDETKGTWNISCDGKTQNGTYTKSSLGLSATLYFTSQNLNCGSVIINPATGEITVTIVQGDASGTGTF
jgi:hypothetical protein